MDIENKIINQTMSDRVVGIDAARGVAILLVFVWHIQPIDFVLTNNKLIYSLADKAWRFFLFEITLIAVPAFIIISVFLFAMRIKTAYFKKRLWRLLYIYIFWTTFHTVYYYATAARDISEVHFIDFLFGGPGNSVFYFLSSLILVTVLYYFFELMNESSKNVISIVLLCVFAIVSEILINKQFLIKYYWFHNFFVVVPIVYFIKKDVTRFASLRHVFLLLYLFFIIHDVTVRYFFDLKMPTYFRISTYFGAITLISICLRLQKIPNYLYNISRYSLGIFAIHMYVFFLVNEYIRIEGTISFGVVGLGANAIVIFLCAATGTWMIIMLIRNSIFRLFIS